MPDLADAKIRPSYPHKSFAKHLAGGIAQESLNGTRDFFFAPASATINDVSLTFDQRSFRLDSFALSQTQTTVWSLRNR